MGENFDRFLKEKRKEIENKEITTVIFTGPVNAVTNHTSLKSIQGRMTKMYAKAKAAGLKAIACTAPGFDYAKISAHYRKDWAANHKDWNGGVYPYSGEDLHQRTQQLNAWIMSQAGSTIDRVIDLYTEMQNGEKYEQIDGIHYSDKGSRAMEEYITKEAGITV